jgi:GNAT superfamily N-acetyltransferase
MSCYPREVTLKDGAAVTVRPPDMGDVEELCRFIEGVPRWDLLICGNGLWTVGGVEKWLSNSTGSVVRLVALLGCEVVALGALNRKVTSWRNALEMKLIVAPICRGRGLGRALFKILLTEVLKLHFDTLVLRYSAENHVFRKILEDFDLNPETLLQAILVDKESGERKELITASYSMGDWARRFELYRGIYEPTR